MEKNELEQLREYADFHGSILLRNICNVAIERGMTIKDIEAFFLLKEAGHTLLTNKTNF